MGIEDSTLGPRRLRYAEAVLRRRTSQLVVVLEASGNTGDQMAVLRTCDCLGVQHVWIVAPKVQKNKGTVKQRAQREKRAAELAEMRGLLRTGATAEDIDTGSDRSGVQLPMSKVSRQATEWLTVRSFNSSLECAQALKDEAFEVWPLVLPSSSAVPLESPPCGEFVPLPPGRRLALVFGNEVSGVSETMLAVADRRIYLPTCGLSEGFGWTVSCALAVQQVLDMYPRLRGDVAEAERTVLRERWFVQLAKTAEQMREFPAWVKSPPEPLSDLRRPAALRQDGHHFIHAKIASRIATAEASHEVEKDSALLSLGYPSPQQLAC